MPSSHPIFISYAHEDAAPARALADALRETGLEVWFDQNELRGGDQWDTKIRVQIKSCGLFIPLISRTTQARDEAYFRLEWKLADDRSHLMAPGKVFIVPVVIDDTAEYNASVPESFSRAQWTRLPDGQPTDAFVAQVKHLATGGASAPPFPPGAPAPTAPNVPRTPPATPATRASGKPRIPVGLIVVVAAIAGITAVAISGNRDDPPSAAPASATSADATGAPPAAPAMDRRSIAVLPFTNMSEDPAANSFFADGVHEDLLTNLAYIGELRVVSRTSVMPYRDTRKPVKQIAEELRVGTLLEGSVRRAGDRVRVTAQLIDASTDEHIWAQTYDRELKDVFAIQGELARAIAAALRIALTDRQAATLAQAPTQNPAAYELFLREREMSERDGNDQDRVQRSIQLLQRAVTLDPEFAQAWALLAVNYAQTHFWNYDRTPERLDLAHAAITKALALAPDDLTVKTHAGSYHYYGYRNYAQAAAYYQAVLDVAPQHVDALASMGFIRRREGKWAESVALHRRAIALDPRNVSVLRGLVASLDKMRHYDRAIAYQQQLVEVLPNSLADELFLAQLRCQAELSVQPLQATLARYDGITSDVPDVLWYWRLNTARAAGDWATAHAMLDDPIASMNRDEVTETRIFVLLEQDELEAVNTLAPPLISTYEAKLAAAAAPGDMALMSRLFALYCVTEQREKARALLDRSKAALQALNDAVDGQGWRLNQFFWEMIFGDPVTAVETVREALRYPGADLHRWTFIKRDFPAVFRNQPALQALLADDDAWAPLPLDPL